MIAAARPLLLLALAASGCAESRTAAEPFTVRDSAGIRIAESREPAWRDGGGWRVRNAPSLQIGAVTDDPGQQLYRVSGTLRLPDGRIVVASDGTMDLRFYSAQGELLGTSGREGEGPGEFRTLMPLLPFRGDSLLAYDYRLYRLSVWDAHGRFSRSIRLAVTGNYWPSGTLEDSLVFLASPGERGMPHLPAYSAMRVDADSNLWVEDYRYLGQAGSRWSVFAPTGRWLGVVDMPRGLDVYQIGGDFVLGVWQDEYGVEFVRLHALEKAR